MGQDNIIELNGKQYDALTGALLGESKIKAVPHAKGSVRRQGRAVDGFIRQSKHAPTVIKPTIKPEAMHKKPSLADSAPGSKTAPTGGFKKKFSGLHSAHTLTPHQPEKPKTLMRHVVHKPQAQLKQVIKTAGPAEMMARPTATLAKPLEKKLSVSRMDPVRLGRAHHVPKSQHIHRFHKGRGMQPNAAETAPSAQTTQHQPVRSNHHLAAQSMAHAHRSTEGERQDKSAPVDVFEAALAHANSHEQKTPHHLARRSTRRRLINLAAGFGAFLLLVGFLAYLAKPGIELKVASMRAGFHAQMPSYTPTGYALDGGIQSSEGRVAMKFASGDSTYKITQEASEWNSATLLDQNAENRGAPTRTIQSKGRTIYIYNDMNAIWVDGGVRYEIISATSNPKELLALANSM